MNAGFKRHPLVRFLASVKLMIPLTLLFALGCAAATFIEARLGTPAARALVYDALWFEILIGLLVLNLIVLLLARLPYRASQTGFVLVHLAMIVILISSGITRFFGYEGIMSIREGRSTDYILSRSDFVQLSAGGASAGYPVHLYKAGPKSTQRNLNLDGRRYRVSVEEYWPHYAEQVISAEGGQAALRFAIVDENGMDEHEIMAGQDERFGKLRVHFHVDTLSSYESPSAYGELNIHYGGEFAKLPVSHDAEASVSLGELSFRIGEFHPDYARRDEEPEPVAMNNPMIRVMIKGGQGRSGERILFAYYPDFSLEHGGGGDLFSDVQLSYSFEPRLDLAADGAGNLQARASSFLELIDMGSGELRRRYAAGEIFDLEASLLYRGDGLSFVPLEIWDSALLAPVASDDAKLPSAVRLAVEGPAGGRASAIIKRGMPPSPLQVGDSAVSLSFGSQRIKLPYRLFLEDFVLQTYPGSENPSGYESHVLLYDEERGIDGEPVRIYMNHPLNYRGYKHFQSSFDPDHRGTVLSVNHDPGKWPTYVGYMLIGLGFALVLAKGLIWPSGKSAAKEAA